MEVEMINLDIYLMYNLFSKIKICGKLHIRPTGRIKSNLWNPSKSDSFTQLYCFSNSYNGLVNGYNT